MSTEQMRQEFEALYAQEISSDLEVITPQDIKKVRDADSYSVPILAGSWWAWQASRAALVVDLPKADFFPHPEAAAWAISECREALKAAGLELKP